MAAREEAAKWFNKYELSDVLQISNPDASLYHSFGLNRATLWQTFRPFSVWQGFKKAILERYGIAIPKQDELQMPGVFLIHRGKILKSHRYKELWDHPDFVNLAQPP